MVPDIHVWEAPCNHHIHLEEAHGHHAILVEEIDGIRLGNRSLVDYGNLHQHIPVEQALPFGV